MPELGVPLEPDRAQQLLPTAWWRTISALEGRTPAPDALPVAGEAAQLMGPLD
jgi:hypothetical protein